MELISIERRLHSDCFHSLTPLSVLPKIRRGAQARSRAVATARRGVRQKTSKLGNLPYDQISVCQVKVGWPV